MLELDTLFRKTLKYLNKKCPENLKGKVISIDKNIFTIKNPDDMRMILCNNVNNYPVLVNDLIEAKGKFIIDDKMSIIFETDTITKITIDEHETYNLKRYEKLGKILKQDKYQVFINEIKKQKCPSHIKNIGIIALNNNSKIINMKCMFREIIMFTGNIYIYQTNDMSNDLIKALKVFHKYYEVELVCVLLNDSKTYEIFESSSKNIIDYLINRSHYPYLVSVKSEGDRQSLITRLACHNFNNIFEFINFVGNKQKRFINLVNNIKSKSDAYLNEIIEKYENNIDNVEQRLEKLLGSELRKFLNVEKRRNDVKKILIDKLNEELNILEQDK